MNNQQFANQFTTIKGAMDILGYKSRNSIEYLIKKGDIEHIWVDKTIRLLVKEDIITLYNSKLK